MWWTLYHLSSLSAVKTELAVPERKPVESLCHTASFQDRRWQLCLCITAAYSHFHSSDDTLTFSALDVLTTVQVTAQVRWRVRQAAHYIGLMKELMNALWRWATVPQCWQQVKRQRMSTWWEKVTSMNSWLNELVYACDYCLIFSVLLPS